MGEDYVYAIKIVLVGNTQVGKSQLLSRYVHNEFDIDSKSTIGVAFAAKTTPVLGKMVKAQVCVVEVSGVDALNKCLM